MQLFPPFVELEKGYSTLEKAWDLFLVPPSLADKASIVDKPSMLLRTTDLFSFYMLFLSYFFEHVASSFAQAKDWSFFSLSPLQQPLWKDRGGVWPYKTSKGLNLDVYTEVL